MANEKPLIVTYYTPTFQALANLTLPRMHIYAEKHGMDILVQRLDPVGFKPEELVWLKTKVTLQQAPRQVVWMDIDCLIVDKEYVLTSDVPLRTALDGDGLCACIMSINGRSGWDLLHMIGTLYDVKGGHKQDQSTLRHLIEYFPSVAKRVVADIPVSDPATTIPGSPVYHAWTSARGYDQAVDIVRGKVDELNL
jgi:hypothetical protein